VNVGEVLKVEPQGNSAKVTFTITDEGRPIREDAFATIRPRIFLEGNFFVDLDPGSPSAPEMDSEDNIPITHTATAVQFDQVLDALRAPQREDLGDLLVGYGGALARTPTAAEDVGHDRDVKGLSGGQAINKAFDFGEEAGKGSARVAEGFLGTEEGDLARFVSQSGEFFGQLNADEEDLQSLIVNFNTFTRSFASESQSLAQATRYLGPAIQRSREALVDLDGTLEPLSDFSKAFRPAVNELPETFFEASPWLTQAKPLLANNSLGAVARDLRIATPGLAGASKSGEGALDQIRALSACTTNTLVPAGDIVIDDQFSVGRPNAREFFYSTANLAGESQNFDGNGPYLRLHPGGGDIPVKDTNPLAPPNFKDDKQLYGSSATAPIGNQPILGPVPPKVPTAQCENQALPDLNGPLGQVGPPTAAAVTP
jgi:ABC-type transporter Mla subunit MlaD